MKEKEIEFIKDGLNALQIDINRLYQKEFQRNIEILEMVIDILQNHLEDMKNNRGGSDKKDIDTIITTLLKKVSAIM